MSNSKDFSGGKIPEGHMLGKAVESEDVAENRGTLTSKMRNNPWIVSTFVLGVLGLVLFIFSFNGGMTGNVVSTNVAGDNLVSYLNGVADGEVKLVDVKDSGSFYEVTVNYQDQDIPVYVTKDGKSYTLNLIPFSQSETNTASSSGSASKEIIKSDKPTVELYVFTYCPYGTQSEKGLIPVVNLLGNKIDFKIRQIGAMHGEFEKIEAERQLCIEKNYPAKHLEYVIQFALNTKVGTCRGDAVCVAPEINALFSKLGIDKNKIETCMKNEGEKLYSAEEANAQKNGVSGSPTLLINGVSVSGARDSASYLDAVCSAFTNAPAECGQKLSSTSPSPGFGEGSAGGSAPAQCAI